MYCSNMGTRWIRGAAALIACLAIIACTPTNRGADPKAADYLIPRPREVRMNRETVDFTGAARISGGEQNPRALRGLEEVLKRHGISAADNGDDANVISIALGRDACSALDSAIEAEMRDLPPEGYVLKITRVNGRPVALLAGASEAGTFYAAQTLDQLLGRGSRLHALQIRDWPAFTRERGYGEFFYGKPWTAEERTAAIEYMARIKMNFYMYSPKDDPYNRDRWREPYPQPELDRMKSIVDLARENFITFSFAMNPGLSIRYSSDEDFRILMGKFDAAYDLGARDFSLQLDDLGNAVRHEEDAKVFKSTGEAHATLMNKVYHALKKKDPSIGYSVCGQMYYIAKPDDNTLDLGRILDPAIPIMWTGGDVVDSEITVPEIYLYASGIRRPPFISDNYPVNDFSVNRLFMGPLTGRANDLVEHVYPGFIENPMNQEEASKIALATIADYAWNPAAYDPERSWNNAIRLVAGDQGFDAMRLFCENNRNSVMEKRESIELAALQNAYFHRSAPGSYGALWNYLERLSRLREDLHATVDNPRLLEEIDPWVRKMAALGEAELLALDIANSEHRVSIEENWKKWNRLNKSVAALAAMPQEVMGDIPHRVIRRVTVGGEGFGVRRVFPSATWRKGGAGPLDPMGGESIDLMIDGNPETAFVTSRGLKAGDWIEVSLPSYRPVRAIRVQMASNSAPVNFIYNGILEYQTGFGGWKPLARVNKPEVNWSAEKPIKMMTARIRVLADQEQRLVVREFYLDIADRPSVRGTMPGLDAPGAREAVNDGSVTTVYRTNGPAAKGQTLELWLDGGSGNGGNGSGGANRGKARKLERVTLLMGEREYIRHGILEATSDGENWFEAAPVNRCAHRIDFRSAGAIRAVRIRLLQPQAGPIAIHEFSVRDSSWRVL